MIRIFERALHSGLVMVCRVVTTGESCCSGGGNSTFTVSVDVAVVSPLFAVTRNTYSPVAENVAVVLAARASANETLPGPDTLLHVVFGAGPAGGDVAAPRCARPARGGVP